MRNLNDLNAEQEDRQTHAPDENGGDSDGLIMEEEPKKKRGAPKAVIAVVVVALVAVGGWFGYSYLTGNVDRVALGADEGAYFDDDGKIFAGVSVMEIDLSGMTAQEATDAVGAAAQQKLDALAVSYTVEGQEYALNSEDMGAVMDTEPAIAQAVAYGREGNFFQRLDAVELAAQSGYDIPVDVVFSEQSVHDTIMANPDLEALAPVDAQVVMNKVSDEDKKITDMEIDFIDGTAGKQVNEEKLIEDIYATMMDGSFATVEAEMETVEPETTKEDLAQLYTEIGVFSTSYSSSADGRRYNIWKMGDIINGVKIEPGAEWSINEEAGPRTYSLGWKGAPGINNGEYKEEAGGGICQVSSTLYNAILRAEVEIVDRSHHSWPLDYVDGGLDATISTGAPDFVIRNNYDVPIYIIARCDGEGDRTIEVAIYGPPHADGLTRDFSSELISTFGGGGPITVADPSLPAGATATIIKEHMGKKFNVYKHLIDENGKEVSKELAYVDTYSYKPAKVRVGTGAAAAPVWEDPGVAAPPVDPAPAPVDPAPAPVDPAPAPVDPAPAA